MISQRVRMMKTRMTFGSWEAITVLVNSIFVQVFLSFPRDMAAYGGSAGWMVSLVITVVVLIYFSISSALYENIGSLDLLDISERVGGRVLKIIVGFLITAFLFFELTAFLGGFSQVLKMISLDKSPLGFVEILFLIGIIACAYFGIEAVVRINAFLLPVVIAGFLLITAGVIPQMDINNIFPVMGEGYGSIAMGSLYKLSAYSSIIILFFMIPFFKKKYIKRVGYMSILISGFLLLWATLSFLLLYPYQIAVDNKIPVFQMAKHIEFGSFLQRIESVFVLICSISSLLYLGVVFTFILHIMQKTLGLKKSKPIILPMAVISLTVSDILKRMDADMVNSKAANMIWLTGLVLPLIIIIFGACKKVGKKSAEGGGEID
jgi:spore germination protein (amino acid permease)